MKRNPKTLFFQPGFPYFSPVSEKVLSICPRKKHLKKDLKIIGGDIWLRKNYSRRTKSLQK